jgi:hypothetical protein
MTIEQEILEQISMLDAEQKKRVLEFVRELKKPQMTLGEWLARAEAFQAELRAKYGDDFFFNSLSVLDEIHEERLNDIMGGG